MKFLRSRRGVVALVVVLLILFVFRPGVYRLRNRIAGSIGSALGRRVEIENVRLHILPQPGFDLEGLVIYDDPAFSLEPMIRAPEVTAVIRLRSLVRGRLEVARLSASEPSINLVRNGEGRWNLANLLERNAHIPVAPTGPIPSGRPAFPYLEATHARINFKIGQEKKPHALTDAEVALWQESENSWGARLKGQPVRTDFNLTDTGQIVAVASWQRATDLRATPLQIAAEWERGQLGQITTLLSGRDHGWRGGVSFVASLSGTPESLRIKSQVSVSNFHRYDIAANENVRLAGVCTGLYSVENGTIADLGCESPVNSGSLKVSGTIGPVRQRLDYDLKIAADQVPIASVLRVLRQAKKHLTPDLSATGTVNAKVHVVRADGEPAEVDGEGEAAEIRLLANGGKSELAFGKIPLAFVSGQSEKAATGDEETAAPHMRIGKVALAMGGTTPAAVAGWVSWTGYRFTLNGDAALKNLFQVADEFGLGGGRPAAEGLARGALIVSGAWQGFGAATIAGRAQLRGVRAEVRGFNAPIEIATATITLTNDAAVLEKISAQTASTHWSGSVTAPRHCAGADCRIRFDLSADHLSSNEIHEWFTAPAARRPWYRLLTSSEQAGPSPLLEARATGTLRVGKLDLKKLPVNQVTAQVELDRGKIILANLRGQLLQGTHQGNWTIDAASDPVKYQASGVLQNISLVQVGGLMNDSWIAGTGDARFEGSTSGSAWAELLSDASAAFHFTVREGSLPHLSAAGPLSVHKLTGDLRLEKRVWEIPAARLESRDGIYQVSGRASPESGWNFKLLRNDEQAWTLSGTLAKPRLERANPTQAEITTPSKP